MRPNYRYGLMTLALSLSVNSYADISATYRNQNAVVLYDFAETSGPILDKSNARFDASGPRVNLTIYKDGVESGATRNGSFLLLDAPKLIKSTAPATRLSNECRKNNAVTIEAWIENGESVEKRSGFNSAANNALSRPLVILGLMRDFDRRNFVLGQFYEMGDIYQVAVNTRNNEATVGNSLLEPMKSSVASTFIPLPNSSQRVVSTNMQKIVASVDASGVGRLYLSDRSGSMYLANTFTNGFGGNFGLWDTANSFLTIGNNMMSDATYDAQVKLKSDYAVTCTNCFNQQNRFWKGKIHLIAVYCNSVPKEEIYGSAATVTVNPKFEIDPNFKVTPELKKAQEIYKRLTGTNTPIVNTDLAEMVTAMNAGDQVGAAAIATDRNPDFYNIVVRDFALKMSNRDETINAPLNDFAATIIGATKENVSAQRLLYDDITYVADPAKAAVPSDIVDDILISNNHYESLGKGNFDLSKVLVRSTQKVYDGAKAVANPTPAGLLTSRQWLAAHAIAGTNRRPVEYALRQFLCTPMESVADSSGPDNVVGRDIDRFPGGSYAKFTTTCKACHTVMDGFRGAFARFTFSNNFVKHSFIVPASTGMEDENTTNGMFQDPPFVAKKLNHNETVFPGGRIITDDSWVNNANRGSNAVTFAWTRNSGKGIKEFGQLIAESKKFSSCMAERVFTSVCKRNVMPSDKALIDKVSEEFKNQQYNLRFLFQRIVTTQECLGGK